jgi:hypothetical protein
MFYILTWLVLAALDQIYGQFLEGVIFATPALSGCQVIAGYRLSRMAGTQKRVKAASQSTFLC